MGCSRSNGKDAVTQQAPSSVLLTTKQVCVRLQVSAKTVSRYSARGLLPAQRIGGPDGPLRYFELDVMALLYTASAAVGENDLDDFINHKIGG